MKRCVIIGGADITGYKRISSLLHRENDFYIVCDCGLRHCDHLEIIPELIVGDFDSYPRPETNSEVIALPKEKDDTDTVYAVKEAVKRGFRDFLIIGAVGNRLDHSLVNVYTLCYLQHLGCHAELADDYSTMEIVTDTACIPDCYSYFSLLAIDGKVTGINISDAKYTLNNAELTPEYQYCTSNEVISGATAKVSIKSGRLLLIKVF